MTLDKFEEHNVVVEATEERCENRTRLRDATTLKRMKRNVNGVVAFWAVARVPCVDASRARARSFSVDALPSSRALLKFLRSKESMYTNVVVAGRLYTRNRASGGNRAKWDCTQC